MSVKNAIKALLPIEWEIALKKRKVYLKFINLIYDVYVPRSWRNKHYYKTAISRIAHLLECKSYSRILSNVPPNDPDFEMFSAVYDDILKIESQWQ